MSLPDDVLWQKLTAFAFDPGPVTLPFARRLARENGWDPGHARRVVEEYRRFVFLALRAGHPVTPSDAVDQAWHLHLTYTRSYWEELCGQVLEKPLHHGPTQGGAEEDDKFRDWYTKTLASYRRLFGAEPPADIWPPVEERFAHAGRFARVDTATAWVLSKVRLTRAAMVAGLTVLVVGGLIACEGGGGDTPFFWGVAVFFVILFVLAIKSSRNGRGGGGSGCSSWWGSSGCGSSGCGSSGCGSSGCSSSGCGGGGCGGGGGD